MTLLATGTRLAPTIMGVSHMCRRFGPIRQVGYVVRDLRKAIDHWVQVADVGPWFLAENLAYEGFAYRGVPGQLKLSVALANSGSLQLELIQPLDQAPSMFREFLDAGQEGMHPVHHLGGEIADLGKLPRLGEPFLGQHPGGIKAHHKEEQPGGKCGEGVGAEVHARAGNGENATHLLEEHQPCPAKAGPGTG